MGGYVIAMPGYGNVYEAILLAWGNGSVQEKQTHSSPTLQKFHGRKERWIKLSAMP